MQKLNRNDMQSTLLSIMGERYYAIHSDAFAAARAAVFNYLNSGRAEHVQRETHQQAVARFQAGRLDTEVKELTRFAAFSTDRFRADDDEDDEREKRYDEDGRPVENAKFINIIRLTGPMTRTGDECSYGSLDHRDMLMRAADCPDVIGHILYTRSPGGMVSTLNDYRKAIDYIHSKGQKIYMFCDGHVASAAVFLGAMCDGIYFYNEDDRIGSIGMFAAFFNMADGSKNSITQEVYVECYADRSTDKNKAERDATLGDKTQLQQETNEMLDELIARLMEDRPSILKEQTTGKMYRNGDVVGTLNDGQTTMQELCDKIYADYEGSTNPSTNQTSPSDDAPSGNGTDDTQAGDDAEGKKKKRCGAEDQTATTMNKEYTHIAVWADGEQESRFISDSDGLLTLQADQADRLEQRIAAAEEQAAAIADEAANRENELTALRAELEALKAGESHELDQLRAEAEQHKADIDTLQKQAASDAALMESLKVEAEKAKTEKEDAASRFASQEQVIADLQAKVAKLESGLEDPKASIKSPEGNGATATVRTMSAAPQWDSHLSPSENKKRFDAYLKEQAAKARR